MQKKREVMWEPREYQVPVGQVSGDLSDDRLEAITPTSVSILSPAWGGEKATIKQYVYLQADARQAVTLQQGPVLGEVQLVDLATMGDQQVVAVIEKAEQLVAAHRLQVKAALEEVKARQ